MRKILVVVDMQNDFIDGTLGTKEAQAIVPNVVKKIKDFDGAIFVTLDTHSQDYMNTLEGKHLPIEHCIVDTEGWNLNSEVMEALYGKKIKTIEKPTFGAVDLPHALSYIVAHFDVEIELIGLCTDICVVSNALLLKASFPEVEISVDASCCAGVTHETHKAALETMKMCQINVIGE